MKLWNVLQEPPKEPPYLKARTGSLLHQLRLTPDFSFHPHTNSALGSWILIHAFLGSRPSWWPTILSHPHNCWRLPTYPPAFTTWTTERTASTRPHAWHSTAFHARSPWRPGSSWRCPHQPADPPLGFPLRAFLGDLNGPPLGGLPRQPANSLRPVILQAASLVARPSFHGAFSILAAGTDPPDSRLTTLLPPWKVTSRSSTNLEYRGSSSDDNLNTIQQNFFILATSASY